MLSYLLHSHCVDRELALAVPHPCGSLGKESCLLNSWVSDSPGGTLLFAFSLTHFCLSLLVI